VEVCPEDAIVWVRDYEYSVYDRKQLLVVKPTLEAIWRNSLSQFKNEESNEKIA
jgi:formate hydrogenlyase subunit 6/NADH:ubiquinone oxidoreductase subunit I